MESSLIERIKELVEEKFQLDSEIFADCFLVEIKQKGSNKVEVFIDSDSGISFFQCQKMSRHIEASLDENKWLGEKYTLDVSSPGVGKPLKLVRQFKKNVGRDLEVRRKDEKPITGELISAGDESFVIQREEIEKEGKKKIKKMVEYSFEYEAIDSALVKIRF